MKMLGKMFVIAGLAAFMPAPVFTTPVVYIYLDRLQDGLRRWRRSTQPAKAVA